MRPENLEKIKEAVMDEYGISNELAMFCAEAAANGVHQALLETADRLFKGKKDD